MILCSASNCLCFVGVGTPLTKLAGTHVLKNGVCFHFVVTWRADGRVTCGWKHTHKKNKETIGQEIGANRRQNVKWNLCCPFGDQVRSAHIQLQSVILQTSTHLNISEDAQILFTVSSQSPTPLGFVHSDDLMSVRNALSFYSQL